MQLSLARRSRPKRRRAASHRRTTFARDFGDPAGDFRRVKLGDQRNAGAWRSPLSRRDVGQAVAEKLLMIEREVGDAGDQRMLDDIGRIESAAEPDFQNAGVGGGSGECEHGGGGRDLEEARLDALAGIEHLGKQSGQWFVVDQLSGDADPFVEADEVRAGEGVDL